MSDTSPIPLEAMRQSEMASGELCLALTQSVPWEDFQAYAESIVRLLLAKVEKVCDGLDERIWLVEIDGQPFYLAYDHWTGVALEARSPGASLLVPLLAERLKDTNKKA